MMNMMRSTSMTSINGVVFISDIGAASPPPFGPLRFLPLTHPLMPMMLSIYVMI
jgi:hypothetical protein